jgi:hypothetical protein
LTRQLKKPSPESIARASAAVKGTYAATSAAVGRSGDGTADTIAAGGKHHTKHHRSPADFRLKKPTRAACGQCVAMESPCVNWRTHECEARRRDGECVAVTFTDGACDCVVTSAASTTAASGGCFSERALENAAGKLARDRREARATARAASWERIRTRHGRERSFMHQLKAAPSAPPTAPPTDDPCMCTGVPDGNGDGDSCGLWGSEDGTTWCYVMPKCKEARASNLKAAVGYYWALCEITTEQDAETDALFGLHPV